MVRGFVLDGFRDEIGAVEFYTQIFKTAVPLMSVQQWLLNIEATLMSGLVFILSI